MSRAQALKRWQGRALIRELEGDGILIRTRSDARRRRGGARRVQGVDRVAEATEHAGLARRVARLKPTICIKG